MLSRGTERLTGNEGEREIPPVACCFAARIVLKGSGVNLDLVLPDDRTLAPLCSHVHQRWPLPVPAQVETFRFIRCSNTCHLYQLQEVVTAGARVWTSEPSKSIWLKVTYNWRKESSSLAQSLCNATWKEPKQTLASQISDEIVY